MLNISEEEQLHTVKYRVDQTRARDERSCASSARASLLAQSRHVVLQREQAELVVFQCRVHLFILEISMLCVNVAEQNSIYLDIENAVSREIEITMPLMPLPHETPQFHAAIAETKLKEKEQELQKEFTAPVPLLYIVILVAFVLFVLVAYGFHFF